MRKDIEYESLKETVDEANEIISELKEENEDLQERIKYLEESIKLKKEEIKMYKEFIEKKLKCSIKEEVVKQPHLERNCLNCFKVITIPETRIWVRVQEDESK